MKRDFYNDFEKFLKENADQYRLYPSSKVWKGIYASLHSRRRWVGLGILLLLLTGTGVTLLITNSSKQNNLAFSNREPLVVEQKKSEANIPSSLELTHAISTTSKKEKAVKNFVIADENPVPFDGILSGQPVTINNISSPAAVTSNNPAANSVVRNPAILKNNISNSIAFAEKNNSVADKLLTVPNSVTDELPGGTIENKKEIQKTNSTAVNSYDRNFDLTIESVLNSYKRSEKKHRIGLQLNVTPTISYRKLSENKAFLNSAAARSNPTGYTNQPPLEDINSAVTHKPDMGLELGLTAKYSPFKNFKITTGLQFNVSRYDIKAFSNTLEVATIALNGGGRQVDSLLTITNYRNYNGAKSNWLHNLYFQVSMPIGVEVIIAGDDKVQLGVAGTFQPTYVLGDRAYLISTDYKNYAEVPWLIRRWNANTAFETFVSYSTGKLKWQVGPQVRYQLLSSFVDKYPVKENLFDFGLKVGIQLNKQ
jgi:hypothetical protein